MGETKEAKAARAAEVINRLEHAMPQAKIELDYRTPLELLVSVILSAQCTDKRVNMVTPALFGDFPSAGHYAKVSWTQVARYIKTLGLFRNKAKNLVRLGQALVAEHGGVVPTTREALMKLPGVGTKTAGVVTIHLGTDQAFPVDTHVFRLARRLGFSRADTPDGVEADLRTLLPPTRWAMAHQLLVWHGRRVCSARAPDCHRCFVGALCPSKARFEKTQKAR